MLSLSYPHPFPSDSNCYHVLGHNSPSSEFYAINTHTHTMPPPWQECPIFWVSWKRALYYKTQIVWEDINCWIKVSLCFSLRKIIWSIYFLVLLMSSSIFQISCIYLTCSLLLTYWLQIGSSILHYEMLQPNLRPLTSVKSSLAFLY